MTHNNWLKLTENALYKFVCLDCCIRQVAHSYAVGSLPQWRYHARTCNPPHG